MSEKQERARLLNTLNKQRNRLRKKGASPSSLREYMGVGATKRFSDFSTTQLKSIYDNIKSQPLVTVHDNTVLPKKYLSRATIWNEGRNKPLTSSYKSALNSNLMKYTSLAQVRKEKKKFTNKHINMYAEQVEFFGDKKSANEIRKLSNSEFRKFINKGQGLIDFSEIFYDSEVQNEENNNIFSDEEENRREYLVSNVRKSLKSLKGERRKK